MYVIGKFLNSYRYRKQIISPGGDDYWLVSYPRSGSTWLRLILANYIWDCPVVENLRDLQAYVPDVYYERSNVTPRRFLNKHRIIKSHEQHRDDYLQVIYVYRRPFDCAWSYYHFNKDQDGDDIEFDKFVSSFLSGELLYGSWYDHLVRWRDLHQGRHIFLSYESIVLDPVKYLREIIAFIGFKFDAALAEKALGRAQPIIVAQITNDKLFYGKEFKTFVKSPLGIGAEVKEKLRSEYAAQFQAWNEMYDEMKNGGNL